MAPSLDEELGRHLALVPTRDQAAYARGFRAAWTVCLARFRPIVADWEARWWRLVAENSRLQARIGLLLAEISRLKDRG
jgi:hypothetical protein